MGHDLSGVLSMEPEVGIATQFFGFIGILPQAHDRLFKRVDISRCEQQTYR